MKSLAGSIVLILVHLFYSCSNNKIDSKSWITNEDEVLNQLFWEVVHQPSPPFAPSDFSKESLNEFEVKRQKWISENSFELYLKDSLIIPDRHNYVKLDLDKEFDSLCFSLFYTTTFSPRKINLSLIPVKEKVKVIPYTLNHDQFEVKIRESTFIGIYQFSHINFDSNFQKACFYYEIYRGPKSAGGYIICAKKKNNKWTIALARNVWIS